MAMTKDELFSQPLWMLPVTGWPAEAVWPPDPLQKPVADLTPDGQGERLAGMNTFNPGAPGRA
jgi:hypothetical protein